VPFLAPIIAAVVTAVTTVTTVVGIAVSEAAVALGFSGAAAGFISGVAVAALEVAAVSFGLGAIESLISPTHSKIGGSAVSFKADPSAGVPLVIGRTGVGGNIVFTQTSNDGHNKWLHYWTVLSHGPVDAI